MSKKKAPGEWEHGSRSTYNNHGCRCDDCRAANTQTTVAVPVDIYALMRVRVADVREWAVNVLREASGIDSDDHR